MTRRDVIKSGAGIAAILAAGRAPAALVKSMLGARMTIASGAKRLPYDAEVEYLGFGYAGKPLIRIDHIPGLSSNSITPGDVVSLKMNFYADRPQSGRNFIASLGYDAYFHYTEINNSKIGGYAYGGTIALFDYEATDLIQQTMIVEDGRYSATFDIGGNLKSLTYNERAKTVIPVTIGGLLTSGSITYAFAKFKLTRSSLILNGATVFDFIPVRVGTVGYMYDRSSGKLFGNQGTGDFVLGPDK